MPLGQVVDVKKLFDQASRELDRAILKEGYVFPELEALLRQVGHSLEANGSDEQTRDASAKILACIRDQINQRRQWRKEIEDKIAVLIGRESQVRSGIKSPTRCAQELLAKIDRCIKTAQDHADMRNQLFLSAEKQIALGQFYLSDLETEIVKTPAPARS